MALIKCPDCGTDVSDAAAACPKCARPIAGQTVVRAYRAQAPAKSKNLSGGFVLLVFVCLGLWIYSQASTSSSSAEAGKNSAAPTALQTLPNISLAERIKTIRNVTSVRAPTNASRNNFVVSIKAMSMFAGGDTAEAILHTLHDHSEAGAYEGVRIDMVVILIDGYGRTSETPLLRLTYSSSDIAKIQFANITTFDVLNLADVAFLNPAAPRIVETECAPDSNVLKYAKIFCASASNAPLAEEDSEKGDQDAADNQRAATKLKACQQQKVDALFAKLDAGTDANKHLAATAAVLACEAKVPSALPARNQELARRYAEAISKSVTSSWLRPNNLPAESCDVEIVQSPGGDVFSASAAPGCPYDDAGKRSVENAVLRSSPLPYAGYESVFARHLTFTFNPAN